jgi:hypothetical protein
MLLEGISLIKICPFADSRNPVSKFRIVVFPFPECPEIPKNLGLNF